MEDKNITELYLDMTKKHEERENRNAEREPALVVIQHYVTRGLRVNQVLDEKGINIRINSLDIENKIFKFLYDKDTGAIMIGKKFTIYFKKSCITNFAFKNSRSSWYSGLMLSFGRSTLQPFTFSRLDTSWASYDIGKNIKTCIIEELEEYINKNNLLEDDEIAAWWLSNFAIII